MKTPNVGIASGLQPKYEWHSDAAAYRAAWLCVGPITCAGMLRPRALRHGLDMNSRSHKTSREHTRFRDVSNRFNPPNIQRLQLPPNDRTAASHWTVAPTYNSLRFGACVADLPYSTIGGPY